MMRAKNGLILVEDRDALSTEPFYERLLDWADR